MGRFSNKGNKPTSNYKEFDFNNGANAAHGRVWVDNVKNTEHAERYPLSLSINGLAIVGCYLIITEKNTFISFPQYKANNGEYKSIVYMYDSEDLKFLTDLSAEIAKVIE